MCSLFLEAAGVFAIAVGVFALVMSYLWVICELKTNIKKVNDLEEEIDTMRKRRK